MAGRLSPCDRILQACSAEPETSAGSASVQDLAAARSAQVLWSQPERTTGSLRRDGSFREPVNQSWSSDANQSLKGAIRNW